MEKTKKYYTVAQGENEVYFVRCNYDEVSLYYIIAASLTRNNIFLMRKVSKLDFETFRKFKSILVYNTNILEFLEGKELKEV